MADPTVGDVFNQLVLVNGKLDNIDTNTFAQANAINILDADVNKGFKATVDILKTVAQVEVETLKLIFHLTQQTDTMICALEHIAKNTCEILTQVTIQTGLQTRILDDADLLRAIAESAYPGAALEQQRLATLRSEIERCCPPAARDRDAHVRLEQRRVDGPLDAHDGAPGAVEDVGLGRRADTEPLAHAPRVVHERVRHVVAPRERARLVNRIVEVDADEAHAEPAVAHGQGVEVGRLIGAGRAPRGPEVEHRGVSPETAQRDRPGAIEPGQRERGRLRRLPRAQRVAERVVVLRGELPHEERDEREQERDRRG